MFSSSKKKKKSLDSKQTFLCKDMIWHTLSKQYDMGSDLKLTLGL